MGRLSVTYQDYTDIYGGSAISEAAWIRFYNDAEALVSSMTFSRIRFDMSDQQKEMAVLAVCAAADALFGIDAGKSITSENNDGYSVAYRAPAEIRGSAVRAAGAYLEGTGLLYRGCDI